MAGTIVLGNAHQVRWRIRSLNDVSSLVTPATGLSLTARLSATPGGDAIDPTLQIALTMGADGDYSGIIPGADITAALTDYVGQTIYERITDPDGDLDEAAEFIVDDERIAD